MVQIIQILGQYCIVLTVRRVSCGAINIGSISELKVGD